MQKAPDHHFDLSFSALEEAFQRARAELRASEAAASGDENAGTPDEEASEPFGERLLMGHELLLAIREPIEWLLALIRRLAAGDPDDVASIDRVTAAFHNRLGCGSHGVTVADALTAFGILIGALDPRIVLAAAKKTITDGVVTVLNVEGSALVAQIERLAEALPTSVRRACASRARRGRGSRARHTL
jgi:hypothetical protein